MYLQHLPQVILDLYPSTEGLEYSLIDRSQGVGPEIAYWNESIAPRPTQEQLEAQHPITELRLAKERKVQQIKAEAYEAIIQHADETKQRNYLASSLHLVNKKLDALIANLMLGSPVSGQYLSDPEASFLSQIDTLWQNSINAIRQSSNARELAVANATTLEQVEAA